MFGLRTSAAVAAAALVTCASVASAAATTKFTTFTPFGVGMVENPNVDGVATMGFQANRNVTHVSAVVHGLLANTGYVVFASSDIGGQEFDITTNSQGKFTLNEDVAGNLEANNPAVIISRGSTDSGSEPVAFSLPG
jgi:hypothetical protein